MALEVGWNQADLYRAGLSRRAVGVVGVKTERCKVGV